MIVNNPLLKPLFMAVARLPLIGPHGQEEVALLKSGAKPVGFFMARSEELADLQKKVEAGQLLRHDVTTTHERKAIIWSWAGTDTKDAPACYDYLMKNRWEHAATKEETAQFEAVRQRTGLAATVLAPAREKLSLAERFAIATLERLPTVMQNRYFIPQRIANYISRRNTDEFLRGERAVLMMPTHETRTAFGKPDSESWKKLQRLMGEKRIVHGVVENTSVDHKVIFGQPGQQEAMNELAEILKEYDRPADQCTRPPEREGQILGYSDADVDRWLNPGKCKQEWGAVGHFLLQRTNAIRRDIRIALMKDAGPSWPRNP